MFLSPRRISRAYSLEEATGPLQFTCTSTPFEHYPLSAYASEPNGGEIEVEVCEGQTVTNTRSEHQPRGVMFGTSRPPLSGRVLMRILLNHRHYALGIGVGSVHADPFQDPEHDDGFLGLYHGGLSTNVCAYAERTYESSGGSRDWQAETKLAILFNFDDGSMQCFEGLKPFGKPVAIKSDDYRPMVVLWSEGDSASIAVDYI